MSSMDLLAIKNLRILNSLEGDPQSFNLVVDGKHLSNSDDENYNGIFNLKELEYPVYFSFNQLLNSLRYSSLYKIDGYKTGDLIKLINSTIENIVLIMSKMEDDPYHDKFIDTIDDIDEKYVILNDRYQTCSIGKMIDMFNDNLDSICDALKGCNRYLYFSEPIIGLNIDGLVNSETGELNPNLIYDDDKLENKTESDDDDNDDNDSDDSDESKLEKLD